MNFILFHGSFLSPQDAWFPYLKTSLERLGENVISPQFPVENWETASKLKNFSSLNQQNLQSWMRTFQSLNKSLHKKGKKCFIGHSLGPIFILHVVEKYNIQLDSAIFISPFLDKLFTLPVVDYVNKTFYKTDFNFEKLKKLIPNSYAIYSDNDPYVDPKYPLDFAEKMGSNKIIVKGAKHFNAEAKFFSFPLVYELCKTRLDVKEYL